MERLKVSVIFKAETESGEVVLQNDLIQGLMKKSDTIQMEIDLGNYFLAVAQKQLEKAKIEEEKTV